MKKLYKGLLMTMVTLLLFSSEIFAQTSVSGKVTDSGSGEPIPGVNILVKGKIIGTITDLDGFFKLSVNNDPPFTLVVSRIGYSTQEVQVTSNNMDLQLKLEEQNILGQEIVVSASRVEESILESPVSIEKMDILEVQNTPADNYYKAIANLKGVDVASSSINFQIINTRGFGSTGNTRFVQLTDGMDTQAPALNFPIGNLNGPSELDVESVELIPGASSALYGPNAFNGILLVNSKNPFEYQGLSAFAKLGANHIGGKADYNGPSPVWDGSLRYAKAFNNKFAFKVNLSYMKAVDWYATSATDREVARTPGFGTNNQWGFNPGADKLNFMGDEASINMAIFKYSTNWGVFGSNSPNVFAPGVTAKSYADAGDFPSHVVSLTPYREQDLIDYNAKNAKANAGLFYRINDKMELSYLYNGGFGTSIYTGAQRYSLKNFSIQQHRLQLRGDNFYLRTYATLENSGDSYITEFLAKRVYDIAINNANPLFKDAEGYLATYAAEYARYLNQQGYAPGEVSNLPADQQEAIQMAAHQFARGVVDSKFVYDLNTPAGRAAFEKAKEQALERGANPTLPPTVPNGPKFNDKTNLFHIEGQYDFKNQIDFMELQAGGSYRLYDLNSNGTIFDDAKENITIKEYGAYFQAGKWLGDRKFKITTSARYDKNQNFKGRVNPRVALVYKVKKDNNIRLSYQTGFRIPSTQGQHIDLNILTARLLGGLPRYAEKYDLVRTSATNNPLAFTGESVQAFRNEIFASGSLESAVSKLVPYTNFQKVKPENVQNIEVGYKSVIGNNLLVDFAYYYNIYNNFITQIRIVTAEEFTTDASKSGKDDDQYSYTTNAALNGTANYLTLLNGSAHTITSNGIDGNTAQIYSNFGKQITSQGAVLGLSYNFVKGYNLSANYNWNRINNEPSQFFSEFNTPEHKYNLTFGNRKVTKDFGFSVTYRWQDAFEWQSSFSIPANGMVPAFSTVDAQVSYKISDMKSIIKVGGSNILNERYIQSLGGPNIGALYYISITFDELMR